MKSFEQAVQEIADAGKPKGIGHPQAPMALQPYTPQAFLDFLREFPNSTPAATAAHFGRTVAWYWQVVASDAFQLALDPVRGEFHNPDLTSTMDERFRALTLRSVSILQEKLGGKEVSDALVLKSVEIGTKSLGLGQAKVVERAPEPTEGTKDIATKLLEALAKQRANAAKGPITVEQIEMTHADG